MQDTTIALLEERDWLAGFARRLVTDAAAADDLIQETWLRALQNAPADLERPRGWLAAVMRSVWLQRARTDSRRERRERTAARAEGLDDVTVALQRSELEQLVAEAVGELPEDQRTVVLLRFREGWSVARVAREVGVSESAVRSRVHRGLDRVRSELRGRFPEDERAWAMALIPLARRSPQAQGVGSVVAVGVAVSAVAATVVSTTLLWPRAFEPWTEPRLTAALNAPAESVMAPAAEGAPQQRQALAPSTGTADAVRVTGRLVDESGRPLADRTLILYGGRRGGDALVTDADGHFSTEVPQSDQSESREFGIKLTDPLLEDHYEGVLATEADVIDLGTLRRSRCGAVRFNYVPGAGGRTDQVLGAVVETGRTTISAPLARPAAPPSLWVLEDGRGLRRGLAAGTYELWLRGERDRWTRREFSVEIDRVTELGAVVGQAAEPGELLTLALVGPDGEPYTQGEVQLTAVADTWFARESLQPDASGRVHLLADHAGPIDVVVSSWTGAFANHRVEVLPSTSRPVSVRLEPRRQLAVEVLDARGARAVDVRVTILPVSQEDSAWLAGGRHLAQESMHTADPTNEPGVYSVRPLARPFLVRVAMPNPGLSGVWSSVASERVDDPSAVGERLTVRLPVVLATASPPPAAATEAAEREPIVLQGRLRTPAGGTPAPTTVALVEGDAVLDAVRSGDDGRFWLSGEVGPAAALVVLPYPARSGFETSADVARRAGDPRFGHALPAADERDDFALTVPARASVIGRVAVRDGSLDDWSIELVPWLAYTPGANLQLDAKVPLRLASDGSFEGSLALLDGADLRLVRAGSDGALELERQLQLSPGERLDLSLAIELDDRTLRMDSGLAADEVLHWRAASRDLLVREGEVRGPLEPGATVELADLPTWRMIVERRRALDGHGFDVTDVVELELDEAGALLVVP